ncbi:hypothetical protein HKD37_01G000174 [Glycine soja]
MVKVKGLVFIVVVVGMSSATYEMDEDQWMYDSIMSEEVDMDGQNEQECGVNEPHVDCSDAFNSSQWARSVAHENGFVAIIIRSDTNTSSRERTSFVLIDRERSSEYRCRKKKFVIRDTGTRKCGCPFKFCGKPVVEGQGWMVKLMCEIHNHELAKSLVGHLYAGRLTKAEKIVITDMTKSMDEDVVRDIFWCHPDVVKLVNACNLVFLINSTYKTNRYKLPLLDFVRVTPTRMTFSTSFAYLEGEHLNNVVWALEQFRGIFLRRDALPRVVVTDRDLALMNAMKTYVMDAWGTLVDCPSEQQFDECLKKFKMVMHLENTTTSRAESAHWVLKIVIHNSPEDLCSVWDAMNNIMMLQHAKIKASFETSTHVVGHVFKKTLYKRLLGMISRYALNQIVAEFERVHYAGKNLSTCGCVMRTTHDLPCIQSICFGGDLVFSNQGLSEPEVSIKEEMEIISKRFEELDVCGKFTLKSKLQKIAYPDVYTYTVLVSAYSNGGRWKIMSIWLEALDWGMAEKLQDKVKGSGLRVKGMTKGLIRVVKEMEKEFVEAESIAAVKPCEKRLSSTVNGGAKPNTRPQCRQSKAPKHNVGTNGGAWDEEEDSGARRSTVA